MSDQELVTKAEADALGKVFYNLYEEGDIPGPSVLAYRVGFDDGRKSLPELRLFREGDPEPDSDVLDVMDGDGDLWHRRGPSPYYWSNGFTDFNWTGLFAAGPVIAVPLRYYVDALRGAK